MQKKQIIMKQLLYNKAIKKYTSIDIVYVAVNVTFAKVEKNKFV
jgi:hypothetical protein